MLREETTLMDLIRALIRKSWIVVLTVAGFGLLAYGYCQTRIPYFGYSGLVQLAQIPQAVPSGKSNVPKVLEFIDNSADLKSDALNYLNYRHIDGEIDPLSKSFVKKIDAGAGTSQFEIMVYGPSLDDAKLYLEKVMADLQAKYSPAIEDFKKDVQNHIKLLDASIEMLQERIKTIEDSLEKISFNANLIQQQTQLERELREAMNLRIQLQAQSSSEKVTNFRFVAIQPMSLSPVSPPLIKALALAMIFGFFLSSLMIILNEEDRRYKSSTRKNDPPKNESESPILKNVA